jgi:hypothetical protein
MWAVHWREKAWVMNSRLYWHMGASIH